MACGCACPPPSEFSQTCACPSIPPPLPGICTKCKERRAQVLANQTEAVCGSCLRNSLLCKFKTAINSNCLITPSDKVLLAFSGGAASRAALEFLLEIWHKAQHDAKNCKDGIMPVFGLGVAFVDEGAILPLSSFERQRVTKEITEIVLNGSQKPEEFLIIPLESIYEDGEVQAPIEQYAQGAVDCGKTGKLQLLLQNVDDSTGKEDLLEHLRLQLLQKVADDHGYTKLILGLCTSRIAAKVVAATAKGQGFSLPADIQYYDSRWKVPLILPLRDCVAKELVFFCHLHRLKTVFTQAYTTLAMEQPSINSLATAFVSMLQEENPSRERTIVCTAAKLKCFQFNYPISSESAAQLSRRCQSLQLSSQDGELISELCSICLSPLNERNVLDAKFSSMFSDPPLGSTVILGNDQSGTAPTGSAAVFPASETRKICCVSCHFQILGGQKVDLIHELLPQTLKKRGLQMPKNHSVWMRSQIKDFLLCDDEKVTMTEG
eukprot:c27239_g1_i4 orf=43-1518(+)